MMAGWLINIPKRQKLLSSLTCTYSPTTSQPKTPNNMSQPATDTKDGEVDDPEKGGKKFSCRLFLP